MDFFFICTFFVYDLDYLSDFNVKIVKYKFARVFFENRGKETGRGGYEQDHIAGPQVPRHIHTLSLRGLDMIHPPFWCACAVMDELGGNDQPWYYTCQAEYNTNTYPKQKEQSEIRQKRERTQLLAMLREPSYPWEPS